MRDRFLRKQLKEVRLISLISENRRIKNGGAG